MFEKRENMRENGQNGQFFSYFLLFQKLFWNISRQKNTYFGFFPDSTLHSLSFQKSKMHIAKEINSTQLWVEKKNMFWPGQICPGKIELK